MSSGSAIQSKALSKHLPKAAADSTNETGVVRYGTSTSNATAVMPGSWKGKWITIQSIDANTQVAYGVGSAPTLVYDDTGAIGAGTAGAGATCAAAMPRDFLVPREATHIAWISNANGGFVEMHLSELNRVGQRG